MTAAQLTIDGHVERAPVLPQRFIDAWRALEATHLIPRCSLTCTSSSVRIDAAGVEVFSVFVTFRVAVSGTSYGFFRHHTQVAAAADEMWRMTGRPT